MAVATSSAKKPETKPTSTDALLAEFKGMKDSLEKLSKPVYADGVTPGTVYATTKNERGENSHGFKTPREFCLKVIEAEKAGRADKRLAFVSGNGAIIKAAGSDEQSGINDQYGGYLVPPTFIPDLLTIKPEKDPIGDRTKKIPMATPIIKIPARTDKNHTTSVSGGLTVTRKPETVAGVASRMQIEQVTMEAHTLFGLSYATEEILMDSPITFAALLADGFKDQFTYHLINERLNGTGIGEFMGVLQSPCLVTVDAEGSQVADTIMYENIVKMRSRCWGYGDAIWIANHDTIPQLMLLNQVIGLGGTNVWQPSAREDHPDLLLGRPIIFTEYAATIGNVGDILLGNWGEYLEGTYQPYQGEESIHVRFLNHERAFKFWIRNAGQPWWRVPLTPKNSTATLSPFVALAAR